MDNNLVIFFFFALCQCYQCNARLIPKVTKATTEGTTASSFVSWKSWTCEKFIDYLQSDGPEPYCKIEMQKVCIKRKVPNIEMRVIESSIEFDKPSMCQAAVDWLHHQSENSTCTLEFSKECLLSLAIPAPLCAPNESYVSGNCRKTLPLSRG